MKLKLKLILIITIIGYQSQAQESGSAYTLEECIDYGLKNNVEVKNARLDEQIATARVKETVGIGLPQVTGSIAAQHSPTQQRFFTQYQPGGFFITDQQASDIGMQQGDVAALENIFQLKGAGNASLNINQLIFNGSYIVGLQASQAYKDLSIKQANQTKEQTVMNISKAFYNLLIAEERLDLIKANISRLDTLYRNTAAMQENGFVEQIDVDRLKVNLNNLKVNLQAMENAVSISRDLLKFQMNYPYDQPINVVGSLEKEALEVVEVPEAGNWDYSKRPDYQVLEANYKLQQLNIKNKYAEALPSIGAFANLGYSTQSPGFGGIFTTEANFSETDQIGPDKWYPFQTVGLSLNWNLFTGLQRSFQIQQQKLSLSKIENGFEALERSIQLEVQRSSRNLDNSIEALEVQSENVELAQHIYDISKIKYEQGVGSSLEVTEADTALKEAQTNYFNALYDAIIAQLELKKSLGTLYAQ